MNESVISYASATKNVHLFLDLTCWFLLLGEGPWFSCIVFISLLQFSQLLFISLNLVSIFILMCLSGNSNILRCYCISVFFPPLAGLNSWLSCLLLFAWWTLYLKNCKNNLGPKMILFSSRAGSHLLLPDA